MTLRRLALWGLALVLWVLAAYVWVSLIVSVVGAL